jgi:hypothetical protein
VGPRTGLDHIENRKFFPLPGLELRSLNRPARSQSLYRLRCPGSPLMKHNRLKLNSPVRRYQSFARISCFHLQDKWMQCESLKMSAATYQTIRCTTEFTELLCAYYSRALRPTFWFIRHGFLYLDSYTYNVHYANILTFFIKFILYHTILMASELIGNVLTCTQEVSGWTLS